MCGRYTLGRAEISLPELLDQLQVEGHTFDVVSVERYNIAPGQAAPVVYRDSGRPVAVSMKWGYTPSWQRPGQPGQVQPINARSETAATGKMFARSFARHRCLVPATGYYEWKAEDGKKHPYYIYCTDQPMFCFAGLFLPGHPEGSAGSYAILTTEPNEAMRPLHHRMPCILPAADALNWLNDELDTQALGALLAPYDGNAMRFHEVSTAVNRNTAEGDHLIRPFADPHGELF